MRRRGNPRKHRRQAARQRSGATCGCVDGNAEGPESQGNLEVGTIGGNRGAKSRGNPELSHWRCQRRRDSGRPGDSPLAQPEGARPRVTWETTSRSRTIRNAGRLAGRIEGDTEGPEFRATWRTVNRHRRRMRGSRRLGTPSPAKPEMQDEGKPEACIESAARGSEENGATR
jgi:hypothetical protein